ncbi:MAG: response regulator [Rickettsiaceae bacterium]|jgi:two-component system alkaline phosphatase synthesis response regulator PhoP|nr:response regulator [Rickettsiaceae bacterium]
MVTTKLVVLVDDDADSLNLAMVSLITSGFAVKSFQDGAAAWAHLKNNPDQANAIILAKTLPNISGMELLKKIQEHKELKEIPVIIQTVDKEDGKITNAIEQGAQFYVYKPIDPKQLIRFVKAAIRSKNNSGQTESFVDKIRG